MEPAVEELPWNDPWEVALRLSHRPGFLFLDSALGHDRLGRFSFAMADPEPGITDLAQLRRVLDFPHTSLADLPPFQGGAAGYIAYEYGRVLEPRLASLTPAAAIAPLRMGLYDQLLAFDHRARRIYAISTGYPETLRDRRKHRQVARLAELTALARCPASPPAGTGAIAGFVSNFTRPAYEAAVRDVIAYILAGDIFQANIAQRWQAPLPPGFDPRAFYTRLRRINAAPFAAYGDFGDLVIASSSPERLVQSDGRRVEARPIKGTRRRLADPHADAAARAELQASRKDRAENIMIVDLLRNDLSRVAEPGSVDVPVLCGLETYASLHHLTSAVTATLAEGCDVVDLLAACFPGGSITGAPKLRAMEIIAEIERASRGVYCGSLGYLGFDGRADLNIAIRTVQFAKGMASLHAGGGITARSDPAEEYEETLVKARRILEAFAP